MDFRGWEKIEEDQKSVTMRHPKGHTMTIAIKALPKIQQEQIKRLNFAKGGRVSDAEVKKQREARDDKDPDPSGTTENFHPEGKLTPIGKMQRENNLKKYRNSPGPKIKGLAEGGSVEDDSGDQPPPPPVTVNVVSPQGGAGGPPPMYPSRTPNPRAVPVPVGSDDSQPNLMLPDKTVNAPQAVGMQQKAIESQQEINAAKDKAMEPALQENIRRNQDASDFAMNSYKEFHQKTDEFSKHMDETNAALNPRHYIQSMGTSQKIATGIGLFLGGMGVPFGGKNEAGDFLDKQIDHDIQTQIKKGENAKTVWGAYKDLYGDSVIATNLAKVSANDLLLKQAELAAVQLGTPQAKQKLMELKAGKALENNQLLIDSAGRTGTLRMNSGPSNNGMQNPSQPGAKPKVKADDDHILSPSADKDALMLKYNPLAKDNLPAINEQKAKADLADKAIDTIKAKYPTLQENTGGAGGYTRRRGHLLGSIPYVGPVIDSAADFVTDTNKNSAYDSDYQSIVGAVRGSLQGNVSDDLLNETVRKNAPETNDPPDLAEKKMRNLIQFVHDHTRTDLLRTHGLSKK